MTGKMEAANNLQSEVPVMKPRRVLAVLPWSVRDKDMGRTKNQSMILYEGGAVFERVQSVRSELHSIARTTSYNYGRVVARKIRYGMVKYCGEQPFLRLPLSPIPPQMGYVSLKDIRVLSSSVDGKVLIRFPNGVSLPVYMKLASAAELIERAHKEIGTMVNIQVRFPSAEEMKALYQKGQPIIVPPFTEEFCQITAERTAEEMRHAVNPDQRAKEIIAGRKKMYTVSSKGDYVMELLNGCPAPYVPPEEKPAKKAAIAISNETGETEDPWEDFRTAIQETSCTFTLSEDMRPVVRTAEIMCHQLKEAMKPYKILWEESLRQSAEWAQAMAQFAIPAANCMEELRKAAEPYCLPHTMPQ